MKRTGKQGHIIMAQPQVVIHFFELFQMRV